jgi:hypothetical protein
MLSTLQVTPACAHVPTANCFLGVDLQVTVPCWLCKLRLCGFPTVETWHQFQRIQIGRCDAPFGTSSAARHI